MSELVFTNNDRVVTSSRNIARDFDKKHKHVLDAIDSIKGVAENWADLFYETTYTHEQNKQEYRQYLINRDGFTLLVMGFTGSKAMKFKVNYINAFNEMEKQLTEPKSELEILQGSINQLVEHNKRLSVIEQKQEDIKDIISLNNKSDWRNDINGIINKIAKNNGGSYQQTRRESYSRLEGRARCDLERRLINKRKRAEAAGQTNRIINNLNKLDVIEDDPKLVEIYIAIVKEMAIEYGVEVHD